MLKTKNYGVNSDGVELVRTYSDRGVMIERDGKLYSEAIDPAEMNREYVETEIEIENTEEEV